MERLLSATQELSKKIESNDNAANELLQQCETIQQKMKGMLQYQSVVQEITGGDGHSRGPPRIEFSYIRQLQQDNSELRTLLEEHQAALEIIMSKYRDQMSQFMQSQKMEASLVQEELSEEVRSRTDQMYHMASVMYEAARIEDQSSVLNSERLSQLEYENRYLRELLSLSSTPHPQDPPVHTNQTPITTHESELTTDSDDSRSSTPKALSFEQK